MENDHRSVAIFITTQITTHFDTRHMSINHDLKYFFRQTTSNQSSRPINTKYMSFSAVNIDKKCGKNVKKKSWKMDWFHYVYSIKMSCTKWLPLCWDLRVSNIRYQSIWKQMSLRISKTLTKWVTSSRAMVILVPPPPPPPPPHTHTHTHTHTRHLVEVISNTANWCQTS